MPKRRAIVFVESIESGTIKSAVLNTDFIGPEVWRGRAFTGLKAITELEDQDLHDLASALAIIFKDRDDCAQQVWFRASRTQSIYIRTREEAEMGTQPKERKRKPKGATKVSLGNPGRPSELAGKKIHIKAKENPRRKGTAGYKSFELMKEGLSVEDFVAAGGRMADLRWDIKHKHVEVK